MNSSTTTWTFEGYWNTVLSPSRGWVGLARDFDLDLSDERGLDEWLGTAEEAAASAGGISIPEEWAGFHAKALEMAARAAGGAS